LVNHYVFIGKNSNKTRTLFDAAWRADLTAEYPRPWQALEVHAELFERDDGVCGRGDTRRGDQVAFHCCFCCHWWCDYWWWSIVAMAVLLAAVVVLVLVLLLLLQTGRCRSYPQPFSTNKTNRINQ
jgi:hypothetical protein